MKIVTTGVLFVLSMSLSVYAQIDTTLRDYFPMDIGNIWEYEEQLFPNYGRYQVQVIGDTIMPNGKAYRVFIGIDEPEYYRMDDSLNVYRYKGYSCLEDSEYVRFRLTAKDSTRWLYCFSTDTQYIILHSTRSVYYYNFGDIYETKYYSEGTIRGWDNMAIRLAKGLGNVYSIIEGPPHTLVGAIIRGNKIGDITSVVTRNISSRTLQTLEVNSFPNPFNSMTTIIVHIGRSTYARLSLFNTLGQEVHRLMEGYLESGTHRFIWNGRSNNGIASPTGIYFCLVQIENASKVVAITLVK